MTRHSSTEMGSTILVSVGSALDRVPRHDALKVVLVQLGAQMITQLLLPGRISSSCLASLVAALIGSRARIKIMLPTNAPRVRGSAAITEADRSAILTRS